MENVAKQKHAYMACFKLTYQQLFIVGASCTRDPDGSDWRGFS